MQLSIIIVNYNVKYFLEQCLSSVYKAIRPLDAEVWVVDNASTDGSMDYLQPKFPWVNFIENEQNVGFAKGNNKALFKCNGEYVLFLNPDTLLPEDCLVKSLPFLKADTEVGAMGIRMIDGTGTFLPESKRSFPSALTSFYKLTGLSRLFPSSRVFSRYSLGWLNEYENHEVDVLAGAFMLARRKVLLELKGFDEDFFMYGEDIDLSCRILKSGYKNYYFGESSIIHFKGKSTKKGSLNYVKIFYQAMSIFVRKHYAGTSARVVAVVIHPAILLRAGISAAVRLARKIKSAVVSVRILKNAPKSDLPTIIAGREEDFNEVKTLVAEGGLEERIVGRITICAENGTTLGTLDNINELISQKKLKEIIFCEGSLSFKLIIETVQTIEHKISIQFHASGTKSIVGRD